MTHTAPPTVARTAVTVGDTTASLVRCTGDVDSHNAYLLRDAVRDALAEAPDVIVVVDLTEVTFAGASAIDALIQGAQEVGLAAADVRLVLDANRRVGLAADAARLVEVFPLYAEVEPAVVAGPGGRGDWEPGA